METFLFGPDERLFGAYYEGLGPSTAPAVLICNGLGQDYMRSHLVLRQLARRLSTLGGPVLQFDYRGMGDSRGDPEVNTLSSLREDVALALQELRDISGRPHVVKLGVRFGAWLALEQGGRVVAWDPILSGEAHVARLRAHAREVCVDPNQFPFPRRFEETPDPELAGYRYADQLLEALTGMSLSSVVEETQFERLALVAGDDSERAEALRILEGHASDIETFSANPAHWNTVTHFERSLTPFPALASLCEAISRW